MMALEQKDTTTPVSANRVKTTEEIIFRRDRALPAPGLEIIVVSETLVDGQRQRTSRRVPQATVVNAWPGAQRTLEAHLLTIIDAATE
jgi:hypothetical protein